MYSSAHNHRALLNVHLWKKEEIHGISVKISMGIFLYVCDEINVTVFSFYLMENGHNGFCASPKDLLVCATFCLYILNVFCVCIIFSSLIENAFCKD